MEHNSFVKKGAVAFRVGAPHFAISAISSGYTLQWSVTGGATDTWNDLDDVPANTNWPVLNSPGGVFFRLYGNTKEFTVSY